MKFKFLKLILVLLLCSQGLFAQWQTVYPSFGPNLPWLNAVEFRDFNNGFTVGYGSSGQPIVLRTTNNGTSWDTSFTSIDTLAFNDVAFADAITAVAVGDRQGGWNPNIGIIARTTDFGVTWTTSYTNVGLTSVCFSSTSIGYAAGNFGSIFKTTDSGNTWSPLVTGSSLMLKQICFINDTIGFACGFDPAFVNDSILKTTDGGITWRSSPYRRWWNSCD